MTSYLRGGLDRRRSAPIDEMQEALLRAALGVEEGEEEEEGGGEARTDAAEPAPAPSPYLWISAMAVGVSQRLPGLTDQERPYLPISPHISPYLTARPDGPGADRDGRPPHDGGDEISFFGHFFVL